MSESTRWPALMGAAEAATYLSVQESRINGLRRAGVLPAVQEGREWKYRRTDLDAYVASLPVFVPRRCVQ